MATVGSVRILVGRMIGKGYEGNQVLGRMRLGDLGPVPEVMPSPPEPAAAPATPGSQRAVLDDIKARGALRAGFLPDSLPFAYRNAARDIVGFDVAMAQAVARELHLRLQPVAPARGS